MRVATLHRRTTGRVSLHEEDLTDRRVLARAVLELVGHGRRLEDALATGRLARLAGGEPRGRGVDRLADDVLRLVRVAVEPVAELVADHLLHERLRLGVAELRLGLPLELGLAELDRDDGGQSLAHVVAGEVVVLLLEEVVRTGVAVDERGERRPEALLVRAALVRVDRVGVGEHVLGVGRGPLHRDLEGDLARRVLRLEGDDLLVDDLGVTHFVQVFDVVDQTALVEEDVARLLRDRLAVLLRLVRRLRPLVGQLDAQSLVEERHLLEPGAERVVVELDRLLEDLRVRPERDARPGLLGGLALLELLLRDAALGEAVPPDEALLLDLHVEAGRQRVHDRGSDAVQTAGDGVGPAAELAARVQDREHDLDRGLRRVGGVRVDGDAAAVVDHAHAAVGEKGDEDRVGVAGQRLIDGVVDDLVDEVVQSAGSGRADVHAWALAHGLESFEDLDRVGAVLTGLLLLRCGCRRFSGL